MVNGRSKPASEIRLDRPTRQSCHESDETRLRSLAARCSNGRPALFKNGPQHVAHYGKDREKWPPSAQNAFLCLAKPAVRVSESANKSPGIFAVTAPSGPGKEGRFLLLLRRRRPKHAQNHFTRHARSINAPARNDQGDVVRDKRPKHLHQRRNTVPEFVQIQSQHNLNFAGPHQRVSSSRSVTFSSQPRARRNPTVSCQPDPAQKAKPHRDLTLLTPARQSFFGGSWNLFKQLSLTHEPC